MTSAEATKLNMTTRRTWSLTWWNIQVCKQEQNHIYRLEVCILYLLYVSIILKNETQEFRKCIASFNDNNNNNKPIKCLTNIWMKNNSVPKQKNIWKKCHYFTFLHISLMSVLIKDSEIPMSVSALNPFQHLALSWNMWRKCGLTHLRNWEMEEYLIAFSDNHGLSPFILYQNPTSYGFLKASWNVQSEIIVMSFLCYVTLQFTGLCGALKGWAFERTIL